MPAVIDPSGPLPVTPTRFAGLRENTGKRVESTFEQFARYVLASRTVRPESHGAEGGRKTPIDVPLFAAGTCEGDIRKHTRMRVMTLGVIDIDKVDEGVFTDVLKKLDPYEHFGYSTWSDRRIDGVVSARIALPLSRPITRTAEEIALSERDIAAAAEGQKGRDTPFAEWARFREGLTFWLGEGVVDPNTDDPSRIYFLPCTKQGCEPWDIPYRPGKPLDVDAIIAMVPARKPRTVARAERAALEKMLRVEDLEKRVKKLKRGPLRDLLAKVISGRPYAEGNGGRSARLTMTTGIAESFPNIRCETEILWPVFKASFEAREAQHPTHSAVDGFENFVELMESALERARAHSTSAANDDDPYAAWTALDHERFCQPALLGKFAFRREASGTVLVRISPDGEVSAGVDRLELEQELAPALKASVGAPAFPRLVKDGVAFWEQHESAEDLDVVPFLWSGDDGLCLRRMPFELAPGPHPAWNELTDRLDDPGAFKAWIWSVFAPHDRGRQMLWLQGEGQDGKSAVCRVLAAVTGQAATSVNDGMLGSGEKRFVNASIYGKRLVIYPDCKNTTFPMSAFAHAWSGGDPAQIEYKGKGQFMAQLNCRIMVAANSPPQINNQKSDRSRVICIRVTETKNNTPDWEARLLAEMPAFLFSCRISYGLLRYGSDDIRTNASTTQYLEELASEADERWYGVFERFFERSADSRVPIRKIMELCESVKISGSSYQRFITFLLREGMRKGKSGSVRQIVGMALKPGF